MKNLKQLISGIVNKQRQLCQGIKLIEKRGESKRDGARFSKAFV